MKELERARKLLSELKEKENKDTESLLSKLEESAHIIGLYRRNESPEINIYKKGKAHFLSIGGANVLEIKSMDKQKIRMLGAFLALLQESGYSYTE